MVMTQVGLDAIEHVVGRATVPLWMPYPLPHGWVCSGVAYAGDERTGACATVTCLTGPSPLGGAAELLIITEEPGVGLGSRHAGFAKPTRRGLRRRRPRCEGVRRIAANRAVECAGRR